MWVMRQFQDDVHSRSVKQCGRQVPATGEHLGLCALEYSRVSKSQMTKVELRHGPRFLTRRQHWFFVHIRHESFFLSRRV